MTAQECLIAISNVYGAEVSTTSGFWNVSIKTHPQKMLVLTPEFVSLNINEKGMEQNEFEEYLKCIPDNRWTTIENQLTCICY